MRNYNLIVTEINNIKGGNKFIKQAKKDRLLYYSNMLDNVNDLPIETVQKFNFGAEVLNISLEFEKLSYFMKYKYKHIDKLETHLYAPELNKIHFRGNLINIKTPYITTIEKAIHHVVKSQSLEQIKSI